MLRGFFWSCGSAGIIAQERESLEKTAEAVYNAHMWKGS